MTSSEKKEVISVSRMREDANDHAEWSTVTAEEHGRHEIRLRRTESILVWLTAVAAGLGSLSLLNENEVVTAGLSVVTVLLAGANAAVKPGERASQHKDAAGALFRISGRLWIFANLKLPDSSTVSEEIYEELLKEYSALDQERLDIVAKIPYLAPFSRPTQESRTDGPGSSEST